VTAGRGDLQLVLRAAVNAGGAGALATVVSVEGSAYRRAGARMWVPADGGPPVGSVSAGCLEAEVVEAAGAVAASGGARLLRLDTSGDDEAEWGWGLGCGGLVEVLVEPARPALAALEAVLAAHRSRQCVALATVVGGDPLAGHLVVRAGGGSAGDLAGTARAAALDGPARAALATGGPARTVTTINGARVFVEVLPPPLRLVICGAGDDAVPLAALACTLNWVVEVVDDRPARLAPERFPGAGLVLVPDPGAAAEHVGLDPATAVVVMSHHLGRDRGYVGAFLGTGAAYLGVLGPRSRLDRILADLAVAGRRAALHGPAGLDLGAEGAPEIAVAVVAQVLAVANGATGAALGEGPGQPGQDRWRASTAASRGPL
jgi:xanthine dehydrogenase accessory factor